MPNVKLSTGVDLYYETHGEGEPLVLIPSTGFSAEAWKPSQLPLAASTHLAIERDGAFERLTTHARMAGADRRSGRGRE